MPDYYPYPEVLHSLNTEEYIVGSHNITARAVDKAGKSQETSILVTFLAESKISGFQIMYIFTGALVGVISIITIYVKRNSIRKDKN